MRCAVAGLLLFTSTAWAVPAVLTLAERHEVIDLAQTMEVLRVPFDAAREPDAFWEGRGREVVPATSAWGLDAQSRLVGRVSLARAGGDATYVLHVPVAFVDEVEVWFRHDGGDWKFARAGDRVPLSQWPFANQLPSFPLDVREGRLDLIVSAANAGLLQVPVLLLADTEFREDAARRANVSGVILGLGLMVAIICLLGAITRHRRANWLLTAVAAWTILTIASANGSFGVWFTPEAPGFNDGFKHFAAMLLAGLMVALVAESLELRHAARWLRVAALSAPAIALAYASVQALWLPPAWRVPGAAAWAAATLVFDVALCVVSASTGGRHVTAVAAGVTCLVAATLLPLLPPDILSGIDLRAPGIGLLLYASLLLFRQAQVARDRYGRDVLGRAAVSANRDPLTALLSYSGFELAYDEALLRQRAGVGVSSVMLFLLPGLEKSAAEHGFVVTERALVRFAAGLQGALGDAWSIARLSKSRFACISTRPKEQHELVHQATQVLARCARMTQPPTPVTDFGMKIACVRRRLDGGALKDLLHEMEKAGLGLGEGKRIAALDR